MVARKAKAFGLNVIGYDPYLPQVYVAKENGITLTSLEEVLRLIMLHCIPTLNETSFHMINEKAFAQMNQCLFNQHVLAASSR